MELKTGRSLYSRPGPKPLRGNANRDNIIHDINKLEMERKILELRIEKIEKTVQSVQSEIHSINSAVKEKRKFVEKDINPPVQKKRHVTIEY